jgi:hypothetical protein
VHSGAWWAAAAASTAIPALYCFTGGMRASLVTDVLQVGGGGEAGGSERSRGLDTGTLVGAVT